mgnify:CR=1 FL=1
MTVEEPNITFLKGFLTSSHIVNPYITRLNNIYKSYNECSYLQGATTNSLDIVSRINTLKEQCKTLENDTSNKALDILNYFKNNRAYAQYYSTFTTYHETLNKIGETNCNGDFTETITAYQENLSSSGVDNTSSYINELNAIIDTIKEDCSGRTEVTQDQLIEYKSTFTTIFSSFFDDLKFISFVYYLVIQERAIHYKNKLSLLYSDSNEIDKINKIIEYIDNVDNNSFINDVPIINAYNPENDNNDKELQTYTEKIEYLISANNKLNTFKEQSFEILQKISSDNGCTQRKNEYIVDLLDTIDSISTKITNIKSEIEKDIEHKIEELGISYTGANTRLADNKRVFDRLMNDISSKKNVVATRDRMLQLSQERNVYKQKVMNILISSLVAIIIMIIFSYTLFSKK